MKSITFPSVKVFKIILQVQQKQSNTNINDSCNTIHTVNCTEVQNDAKKTKTEPIQILLSFVNIDKISRNFVDLNINLCTIIPQSFSYFGCFALKLCTV